MSTLSRRELLLGALAASAVGCEGSLEGGDGGTLPRDAGGRDVPLVSIDAPPTDAPLADLPSWLDGHGLHEWFPIPGTSGAGGSAGAVDAYSGMFIKDDNSQIGFAAAGGHGVSDNSTVSIILSVDAPTWRRHREASVPHAPDVPYEADGQPAAMHLYHSLNYSPLNDRVMRIRPRFTDPSAYDFNTVDGFDLTLNQWDGEGVHPLPGGYGLVRDSDGNLWTTTFERYDVATRTWSSPITTRTSDQVRFPAAFDSRRRQIFTFQFGDGQGVLGEVSASRVPIDGSAQYHVTIADSPAYTQYLADAAMNGMDYSGLEYDPVNDRFFHYGGTIEPGRVYVITPNDGDTWDMSILSLGPGNIAPPRATGVHNRLRYCPQLRGMVLLARGDADLCFIRTSD